MSPEVRRFEQIEPKSLQRQVKKILDEEQYIRLVYFGGRVIAADCEHEIRLISVKDSRGERLAKTKNDCQGKSLIEWSFEGIYGTSKQTDLHKHPRYKEGTPCKQFSTKRRK